MEYYYFKYLSGFLFIHEQRSKVAQADSKDMLRTGKIPESRRAVVVE
jgi:hypothetical protein